MPFPASCLVQNPEILRSLVGRPTYVPLRYSRHKHLLFLTTAETNRQNKMKYLKGEKKDSQEEVCFNLQEFSKPPRWAEALWMPPPQHASSPSACQQVLCWFSGPPIWLTWAVQYLCQITWQSQLATRRVSLVTLTGLMLTVADEIMLLGVWRNGTELLSKEETSSTSTAHTHPLRHPGVVWVRAHSCAALVMPIRGLCVCGPIQAYSVFICELGNQSTHLFLRLQVTKCREVR